MIRFELDRCFSILRILSVFLVGISCVGKTTIANEFAKEYKYKFYDLDEEIETFFNKSISNIQSEFLTVHSYRTHVSVVLKKIIKENGDSDYIVALSPSGLMGGHLKTLKILNGKEHLIIFIHDRAENILKRITFYDSNSNLLQKKLTEKEKKLYLREIKKDYTYYKQSYKKADYKLDIDGLTIRESARRIKRLIDNHLGKTTLQYNEELSQKEK